MWKLWSSICSCLHGLSWPRRTHAALGGFVLCSAVKMCVTTANFGHQKNNKKNPQMIQKFHLTLWSYERLVIWNWKLSIFFYGILEIDASDEHKSLRFLSWLSVPGCNLPTGFWFTGSWAICWKFVNTPVCIKSFCHREMNDTDDMMFTFHDLTTDLDRSPICTEHKLAYGQNMFTQLVFFQWGAAINHILSLAAVKCVSWHFVFDLSSHALWFVTVVMCSASFHLLFRSSMFSCGQRKLYSL